MMEVSVVIPTLNAGERLRRLLLSLREQTIPLEIIVVDSSSEDETPEIARRYAHKFMTVRREDFNHGLTRNLALSRAEGEVVVFMSQDALPEREDTIETLIRPLERGEVVLSYARHIPPPGTRPPEVFFRLFSYPPRSEIRHAGMLREHGLRVFSNSNVCAAYLKEKLLEIGGFPRVILSEDLYAAARLVLAGYRIMYNAEARVYHAHHLTLKGMFQRYFSIGVFYAENRWIKEYGGRGDTLRFFLQEMLFLAEDEAFWIPYAVAENMARLAGLLLGMNYRIFPKSLLPALSGYRHYF